MRRTRRQNERGFALLLVFAMAAAVVAMLYMEMPRVAFEHQRNKEGLLAERGEQYIRAIQLFYKKTNRYPQKIEDLESTNNTRFLRRRYKDPMTGDEEWRLIHVDSAGQYVDSLIHKRTEDKKESGPSALSSNIIGIGASAEYLPQAGDKTGAAGIRRASDRIIPGMPAGGPGAGQPGGQSTTDPATDADQSRSGAAQPPPLQAVINPQTQPNQTAYLNPQQGQTQGTNSQQNGLPGQTTGTNQGTSANQQGNAFGSGGGFGMGGGFGSGSGTGSTSSGSSQNQSQNQGQRQIGGFPGTNQGSNQGSGGFGQSGFGNSSFGGNNRGTQGAPNQAVQAIQNMLTNPRQANAGSMGPTGGASANGGPTQGGIVGVASKKDMEGIRLYNEHSNYKEWEFLYDRKKALEAEGLAKGGQPGQQGQQGNGVNGMQGQGQNSNGGGFSFGGSGGQQQPRPAPGGFGSGGFGSSGSSGNPTGNSGFGRGN